MSSSIDINWTNRSTSVQPPPDKNIVERVEQARFDDTGDTASVQTLAQGSGGGLSPTVPNGSYTDTTMDPGCNYSYRVVAERSGETKSSLPTEYIHTYDSATELGYPSGTPATAGYMCSVDPHAHIDLQRVGGVSTAYDDGVTNFRSATRIGDMYFRKDHDSGSDDNVYLDEQTLSTGRKIRFPRLQQYGNPNVGPYNLTHLEAENDTIYSRDEMTMFVVVRDPDKHGFFFHNLTGSSANSTRVYATPSQSGIHSIAGNWSGFMFQLSTNYGATYDPDHRVTLTVGSQTNHAVMPDTDFNIFCVRLKISEALASASNVRAQLWRNGQHLFNTEDLSDVTAAGYAAGVHSTTSWTSNFGAYSAHPYLAGSGSNYITRYYKDKRVAFTEYFLFPHALNADDLNQVTAYLCNKHGEAQTIIPPSDLIE